ncbi:MULTISPECIES: RNA polymerase sigma factor [Halomonadaceae]|uniref:RNA polymerase sigma factor n=1 Tax=Halomonadaceae TaxID=28256 RepID=UPI00110F1B7A|nr:MULTISPECIES: RNA polymerase sigma factor [Halomonas]UEQ04528.1 RNA polymerase sigma factor [Halomonas profundus]QNU63368.1 RNA polymerase sigma factor [Halomonas titanicae]TMU24545.1 RNA polymerase sigma factor [Halomonas sp. ATBC28]CAD5248037.1 RNA polymerase ECF-subfamily sigma factor [Halomonas sp. I3]CAD5269315.1 RNA polymerase ECF-subfamily sigma factor [Halomonas sp. 113]
MSTEPSYVDDLYREHSRRVQATLIRLLGDFELAEEAMQDAFVAAVQQWPVNGKPDNPTAWLIRTGYHCGIDQIRQRSTARRRAHLLLPTDEALDLEPTTIEDDALRLLFTCCHPSLSMEARIALTLREMCGLTTEQVASALLMKPTTLAQRIVRAKRKIRDAHIPYAVPTQEELPERLPDVLQVIYLVFNEGYSRSTGASVVDISLTKEAMRLGNELARLLPQGEVFGLMALMLLNDARRDARQDSDGELVTLDAQDRRLWRQEDIQVGITWLEQALALTPTGYYTLQASIAAVHAQASHAEQTDWGRIVRLYDALCRRFPSPILALNRAVAIAMNGAPDTGLKLLDDIAHHPQINRYYLFHAAKADLLRRQGQHEAARSAYQQALLLVTLDPEKRFLNRRLAELENSP